MKNVPQQLTYDHIGYGQIYPVKGHRLDYATIQKNK